MTDRLLIGSPSDALSPSRRALLIGGLAAGAASPSWLAGCTSAPGPAAPGAPAVVPPSALPAWTPQPVFTLSRIEIRDARGFADYALGHTPSIAVLGGRFLAAGALPEVLEGPWPARRMVIHQWRSAQVFFDWYHGAAYAPFKRMRHASAHTDMVLVQGLASSAPVADAAPTFVVMDIDVRDPASFGRYAQGHLPGMRAAGGEYIVAGGRFEVIEGDWKPRRLVVQRWLGAAPFRVWYESAEYRPWRTLRQNSATTQMALLAGLSERAKIERRMP